MSCFVNTKELTADVICTSTEAQYIWLTPWYPSHGMDKLRAVLSRKQVYTSAGTMSFQVVYQTAAIRPDNPDAPALLGSAYTGDGEDCTGNLEPSTTSKFYARFGVAVQLSQAGFGRANVFLRLCIESFGKVVGSLVSTLIPPNDASYYLTVTDWMPAMTLSKAKAAFMVTDSSANSSTSSPISSRKRRSRVRARGRPSSPRAGTLAAPPRWW